MDDSEEDVEGLDFVSEASLPVSFVFSLLDFFFDLCEDVISSVVFISSFFEPSALL